MIERSRSSEVPSAATRKIRVVFCGVDADWRANLEDPRGIRRRHLFFLKAFAKEPHIGRLEVVERIDRLSFLAALWHREPTRSVEPEVEAVRITWALPERAWLPWTSAINLRLARWWLRRHATPSEVTVVWCYAMKGISLALALDLDGIWFVDTDHDILHDPNQKRLTLEEAEEVLLRAARRARWVFSGSRNLLRWLGERGIENRSRLRNGVCTERFEATSPRSGVASERAPVLGYLGVLSPWIDFDFFLALLRRRPRWRFVVAGPWYRMRPLAKLRAFDNLELRGRVPSHEVPSLLAGFDIGLGLYRPGEERDVDSMKIFEYLGARLPVVSTPFHPWLDEDFAGLVSVAGDVEAFATRVEEILAWSEADRRQWEERCCDFVAQHTWSRHAGEALDVVLRAVCETRFEEPLS